MLTSRIASSSRKIMISGGDNPSQVSWILSGSLLSSRGAYPPLLAMNRGYHVCNSTNAGFSRQLHIRSQPTYQPTTLPASTHHGTHPQKSTEKFKEGYSRGQQFAGLAGGEHRSPRKSFSPISVLKLLRSLSNPHKT